MKAALAAGMNVVWVTPEVKVIEELITQALGVDIHSFYNEQDEGIAKRANCVVSSLEDVDLTKFSLPPLLIT